MCADECGSAYSLRMLSGLRFGSSVLSLIWIPAITLAASGVVIALSRRRGADRTTTMDWLVMVWLLAAVAAAAILTLQPGPQAFDGARPSILNPISRVDVRDAVANVMLYLPVGFFAALFRRSKPRPVVWATGLALSLSLLIESAQLLLPIDRAATTHDVIFNTVGGFIGAVAGTIVVRTARRIESPTAETVGDG